MAKKKGVKAAKNCADEALFAFKQALGFEVGIEASEAAENLVRRVEKILDEEVGSTEIPRDVRVSIAQSIQRTLEDLNEKFSAEEVFDPESAEVLLRKAMIKINHERARLVEASVKAVHHNRVRKVLESAIDDLVISEGLSPTEAVRSIRAFLHRATAGDVVLTPKDLVGLLNEAEPVDLTRYIVHKKSGKVFRKDMPIAEQVEAFNASLPEGSKARIDIESLDVEKDFVQPIKSPRPFDAAMADFNNFKNRIQKRMEADPVLRGLTSRLFSMTDPDLQYAVIAGMASDVKIKGYVFADEAFAISRILKEETRAVAEEARDFGVSVSIIDNWVAQSHMRERILADPGAWKRFILENDLLDPEFHPDPEASLDAIIENMRDATVSEIFDDFAEFKSPHRQLWFRKELPTGESGVVKYLKEYGPPAPLLSTFSSIGKLLSYKHLHAALGPYPFSMMEHIIEMSSERLRKHIPPQRIAQETADFEREVTRLRVLMNEERGLNDRIATGKAHSAIVAESMRRYAAAGMLSNIFMYSLTSDPALAVVSLVQTGAAKNTFDAISLMTENLARVLKEDDVRDLVSNIGIHHTIATATQFSRMLMATDLNVGVTSKGLKKFYLTGTKAAHFIQKYSGTDMITRAVIDAWALSELVGLKRVIDNGVVSLDDFAELGPLEARMVRRIRQAGVSDDMFSAWRAAAQSSPKNFLDPSLIEDPFAAAALRAFLASEHRFVIGSPDSYTRAIVKGAAFTKSGIAPERGTLLGETIRSFFGFQSMPMTIFRYTMMRSLAMGAGPTASMLVSLGAVMYMKMQLQEMLAGRRLYGNPATDPVAATTLMQQMGVFWWFGDVARSVAVRSRLGRWDDAVFGDISGPVIPLAADAVSRQLRAFSFLIGDGDVDRFLDQEARFIHKNLLNFVPGQNSVIVNMGLRSLTGDTFKGHMGSLLGLPHTDTMRYDRLIKEGR